VLLLAGALLVPTLNAVQNPIRINSLGFLPDQAKQASVGLGGTNFTVLRAAGGEVAFHGPLTGPLTNADTEEVLFTADFSVLRETGTYQLEVPGLGRSPVFGRNVHGRSYVTGLGHQPPLHPHDRGSASDGVLGPWPDFLVGGPHPRPTDWFDVQEDYRTNEIAINWNSALVYALAWLVGDSP
jgi:hypothetical protein